MEKNYGVYLKQESSDGSIISIPLKLNLTMEEAHNQVILFKDDDQYRHNPELISARPMD